MPSRFAPAAPPRRRAILLAALLLSTSAAVAALPAAAQTAPTPAPAARRGSALPGPNIPDGWGVNLHTTDLEEREIDLLREAGFGFARADFSWNAIEAQRGVYDFSAYDRLYSQLTRAGARPLFLLGYGNDLYQSGGTYLDGTPAFTTAPTTPEARAAFARWAAAAALHFKGRPVVWEIWNEPNLELFWPGGPDSGQYTALALETAQAMRAADPDCTVAAPGMYGFGFATGTEVGFMEQILQSGLLPHIDAVSVHPYRRNPYSQQAPESVSRDHPRLRALIDSYSPAPSRKPSARVRHVPVLSSEWGYMTGQPGGVSDTMQAAALLRSWLLNAANGVNLSIWFNWRDSAMVPQSWDGFGLVRPDLSPKPSYQAAKKVIDELRGYRFWARLSPTPVAEAPTLGPPVAPDPTLVNPEWVLLFRRGPAEDVALVTWKTAPTAAEGERTPRVFKLPRRDTAAWTPEELVRRLRAGEPTAPIGR